MVEVFSQPNCVPCTGTKKFLKDNDIAFVEYDVTQEPERFSELIELGFKSTPVVRTSTDAWAGLQLNKLRALV